MWGVKGPLQRADRIQILDCIIIIIIIIIIILLYSRFCGYEVKPKSNRRLL
jgi:hypothetical protein